MTKTVPEMLRSGADTYEERNKMYGDNYKRHGSVMAILFPNGLKLETVEDHNRFGILTQKVAKLTRYCENFTRGGHADSLHDDMVYTAMLAELDAAIEQVEAIDLLNDPTVPLDWDVAAASFGSPTDLEQPQEEMSAPAFDEGSLVEPPNAEPPMVIEDELPQK